MAASIMTEIIAILVSALSGIGQGIGDALSSMATSIFLSGSGDSATLSVFGSFIVIFAAISLGFSLTRWVLNFFTSLGNRNR